MEGLVPRERIRVFDIGSLIHVGAAIYLRPGSAQLDPTARYKMARQAIVGHFETMMRPLNVEHNVLDEAVHTFPVIMRRRLDIKPIAVEQWWEMVIDVPAEQVCFDLDTLREQRLDLPAFKIHFVGKADAISKMGDAYVIEEHKSVDARGFGEKKIAQYQKSRQTKGYVLLAQHNLKNTKVVGVVHNFFLKKKEPELRQEITMVGPRDLERAKQDIIGVAEEMLYAYRNNHYRENTDNCHSWIGACPYCRLCEFGDNPEIRQQLFTTEIRDERLSRLDTISKRAGSAENVSEATDASESGVEK